MGTLPELTAPDALRAAVADGAAASDSCRTEFYLTGFSRFHSVPVNPTEEVANNLPAYLKEHPLRDGSRLVKTHVLKVAGETTRAAVEDMHRKFDERPVRTPLDHELGRRRRVVLHLGVNAAASKFQLEIQARNEATFSCADELGWAPIKREIDSTLGDLTATCSTKLRVSSIVNNLCRRGFDVEESSDAGRFVCNWTYFHSLRRAQRNGTDVLFVHVPHVKVANVQSQIEFIKELMDVIAELQ